MANAKGRGEWNRILFLGECIINSQPHFGKGHKKEISLMHLNPFTDEKPKRVGRGVPLRGNMGERALDACSVEAK